MGRLGHPAALLLWLLLAAAAVPRSAGVPIPLQVTDGGQPPPSTDAADLFPEANAEAEAETEAETEPAAGDASDAGGADSFEPPGNDTGSPRSEGLQVTTASPPAPLPVPVPVSQPTVVTDDESPALLLDPDAAAVPLLLAANSPRPSPTPSASPAPSPSPSFSASLSPTPSPLPSSSPSTSPTPSPASSPSPPTVFDDPFSDISAGEASVSRETVDGRAPAGIPEDLVTEYAGDPLNPLAVSDAEDPGDVEDVEDADDAEFVQDAEEAGQKPHRVGLEELTPGNVQDGVRDWERIYLEQEDSGERDGRTAGDGSGPDVGTVTEGEWATAEDPEVAEVPARTPVKRLLDVRVSKTAVTVVARRATPQATASTPERLTFTLRRAGLFRRRAIAAFEYRGDGAGRPRVHLRYEVLHVIEYVPGRGSEAYRPRNSTRVQELRPQPWGALQYEVTDRLHTIRMATKDGRLALVATVQADDGLSPAPLDPNLVRLETQVVDFPYRRADTRLCLVAEVTSNTRRVLSADGEAVLQEDGGPLGRFSWVPEAHLREGLAVRVASQTDWAGTARRQTRYHGRYYCSLPAPHREALPAPSPDPGEEAEVEPSPPAAHLPGPSVLLMLADVDATPRRPARQPRPPAVQPGVEEANAAWLLPCASAAVAAVALLAVAGVAVGARARRRGRPQRSEYIDIY